MRAKLSISAAGDFLPQRRIPEHYEGFEEVASFIKRADARFFNLETTFPDEKCFGHQFYGGAYLRADERILDDARRYGFNMLSFANNHAMDYAYRGLRLTMDAVARAGFPSAGVGLNLDEAAAPAYLDTGRGSVGVIGVVSTMMNIAAMAGRQSRRIPGRPGVNGLRVDVLSPTLTVCLIGVFRNFSPSESDSAFIPSLYRLERTYIVAKQPLS